MGRCLHLVTTPTTSLPLLDPDLLQAKNTYKKNVTIKICDFGIFKKYVRSLYKMLLL